MANHHTLRTTPSSTSTPYVYIPASYIPLYVAITLIAIIGYTLLAIHGHFPSWWQGLDTDPTYAFLLLLTGLVLWFILLTKESLLGFHTGKLQYSLRIAFLLFILSEVFFFVSFFWAFFDSALSPTIELGLQWPPLGITPFSCYSIPLLNTVLLLSSGDSITWTHHSLTSNYFIQASLSLLITITLGSYFLYLQYVEYNIAPFTIQDGIYGSTFYLATGFHGIHVILGTTILSVCLFLLLNGYYTHNHHLSFELRAWYWHFVDVVWLFLYISIYWWGPSQGLV